MAIYTLNDFRSSSTRSSSIPRQYNRIAESARHEKRFSVTDGVHLKLQLQALDNALSNIRSEDYSDVTVDKIIDACQSRPFHETVYVAGSEEFYLLVKGLSRADLIPHVYAQACISLLHGRHYANEFKVSDFNRGVDPTFSEIRPLLGDIDRVCETDLSATITRLEDAVKPFPFLCLPAELRVQVYSHLLPHEPYITLLQQHRERRSGRLRLDVMRVNKQLHNEVRKHFYEHRTLFMVVSSEKVPDNEDNPYIVDHYASMLRLHPDTIQLIKQFEIKISDDPRDRDLLLRSIGIPHVADPMRCMFSKLVCLKTLVLSFDKKRWYRISNTGLGSEQKRVATVEWLMDRVPAAVDVSWNRAHASEYFGSAEEQRLWQILEARGSKEVDGDDSMQLEHTLP